MQLMHFWERCAYAYPFYRACRASIFSQIPQPMHPWRPWGTAERAFFLGIAEIAGILTALKLSAALSFSRNSCSFALSFRRAACTEDRECGAASFRSRQRSQSRIFFGKLDLEQRIVNGAVAEQRNVGVLSPAYDLHVDHTWAWAQRIMAPMLVELLRVAQLLADDVRDGFCSAAGAEVKNRVFHCLFPFLFFLPLYVQINPPVCVQYVRIARVPTTA